MISRRLLQSLVVGVLCVLPACQQDAAFKPDPELLELIRKHEADVPALVQGNNDFAFALHRRLGAREGNIFFSPYSISTALAMTYAGARNNTAKEMRETLRFPFDGEKLHATFANMTLQTFSDAKRPYQLSVANRLWGQQDFGFEPDFLKLCKNFYHAGLAEVDFVRDPDAARQVINAWVEKQTNERIKDLLPPLTVNTNTRLVLANAIYFKARWKEPFDIKLTRPDAFYVSTSKKVQTPFMQSKPSIRFAAFDSLSLVELDYEGDDLSMVILLPNKIDGLKGLEADLTKDNWTLWLNKLRVTKVDLKLPKFKITAEFSLKDDLVALGMRDAFGGKADFSGLASSPLHISAVQHKAFIEVNEKETEAAAATAVIMEKKAAPAPPPMFHADHPFLFLIRDKNSGSVLFLGRFSEPPV